MKQAGLASSQDVQSAMTPSNSPRPRLENGLERWGEEGKTAATSPNNSHSSSLWTGPSHTKKDRKMKTLNSTIPCRACLSTMIIFLVLMIK